VPCSGVRVLQRVLDVVQCLHCPAIHLENDVAPSMPSSAVRPLGAMPMTTTPRFSVPGVSIVGASSRPKSHISRMAPARGKLGRDPSMAVQTLAPVSFVGSYSQSGLRKPPRNPPKTSEARINIKATRKDYFCKAHSGACNSAESKNACDQCYDQQGNDQACWRS
jgi:hypothetical protein